MREISFVKKLKFNFPGSVTKRALVIGDADNDQRNELVCANLQGDLAIFKDCNPNRFAYAAELGMVTACVIGDIMNLGRNYVSAINTEGWLFIFDLSSPTDGNVSPEFVDSSLLSQDAERISNKDLKDDSLGMRLKPIYDQRMPANCKEMLLADLDGDGQNEVIIGLTDRVLRTYKWIKIGSDRGKFVGLYKWEFADQIGAVSLNPSRHENCQDILVAQPGGTYAKLECFDKKPTATNSNSASNSSTEPTIQAMAQEMEGDNALGSSASGDNVRTEYISKLTPEYHQLALTQMRNHHISTEILGGIKNGKGSRSYSLIVIATLDGTLMLANKDEILWSLQVDHQLFALATLTAPHQPAPLLSQSESTCTIVSIPEYQKSHQTQGSSSTGSRQVEQQQQQYFVVCAWNGKTYIIDEDRNYLRFKFEEAVSAFTAGSYHFDGRERTCLVYATFNNQIVLYYDVVAEQIRPMYLLEEILQNPANEQLRRKLEILAAHLEMKSSDVQATQLSRSSRSESGCNLQFETEQEPTTTVNLNDDSSDNDRARQSTSERLLLADDAKLTYSLLRAILYNLTDAELQN